MKLLRALSALVLALAFGACAHSGLKATGYQTQHVVVLVLDGPRQSEMWAEKGRPHVPRMARELLPQGVLLSGFRNNGPTYTSAGHTALCTSHYEDLENSQGSQLPSRPSFFQVWRKAAGTEAYQARVIVSKDKLAILGDSAGPKWHGRYQPEVWAGKDGKGLGSGYGDDAQTKKAVMEQMLLYRPALVLVNLKQPDAAGHAKDWSGYLQGIRDGDAFAADLWAFIQHDHIFKDHTALFITHDHGRHLDGIADGFVSHGDGCEGCRHIALLALGPDFKQGVELPEGGEQVDLAPTIGKLLGFTMPQAEGKPLLQLFKDPR